MIGQVHCQRRRLWLWSSHCLDLWLVDPSEHPLPVPAWRSLRHRHPPDGLCGQQDTQPSHHYADHLLSTCHRWLCHHLEERMVASRCCSRCRIFHHWNLWRCSELGHHHWHVQRSWTHQEKLHGRHHLRCLLCWQHRRTTVGAQSDQVTALPRAMDRAYYMVSINPD